MSAVCSKPACVRPAARRGMCNACYETFRTRQTAYGRWESLRVDAEPARQHVAKLLAAGLGTRRVAELAGTRRQNIQTLINGRSYRGHGPSKRICRDMAGRIVAIPLPDVVHEAAAAGQLVAAVGTARRLRALVAIGWPQNALCRRLGILPTNGTRLFRPDGLVKARTARDVAALFDALQLTPGPSVAARRRAARLDWAPPLAWDEDSIDDPTAQPDRGDSGRVPFAERWAELQSMGLGWRDAVHRWQTTPQALAKRLERDGLPVPAGLYTAAQARRAARAS